MAGRIVDPHEFIGIGSIINWAAVPGVHSSAGPIEQIAKARGLTSATIVQLRWAFDSSLGYPRTPFTVWARAKAPTRVPVTYSAIPGLLGTSLVLDSCYAEVVVTLSAGPGGAAIAWSGMPLGAPMVGMAAVAAGATAFRLTAPQILMVTVPPGSAVASIEGRRFDDADDPAWQQVEIVGLPSDGRTATRTDLTGLQGMVTALTDPISAAGDRYRRGAPFYGWSDEIAPGVSVEPWTLALPESIIKVFLGEMLDDFIIMVDGGSSAQQEQQVFTRSLTTPSGHVAQAQFNPLKLLLYGASSDPLDALVTGFGTAYPLFASMDTGTHATTHMIPTSVGVSVPDFMITATFVDDLGNDVERAALILGPGPTLPPPLPAALAATSAGSQAPAVLDDPFRPVVTVSWDKPSHLLPFLIGSHGLARRATAPAVPAGLLMQPRMLDTARQALGSTVSQNAPNRRSLSDTTYPIDSSIDPNQVRYAVATQDVFGVWSGWAETGIAASEPPVGKVTLTGPQLNTTVAAGACPGTLTVDLSWNWSSRSPSTIEIAGRAYPQTWPDQLPADLTPPAANTFSATGAGLLVTISFATDGSIVMVTPGTGLVATVEHVSLNGQSVVTLPLLTRGERRYRLTVSGLSVDFPSAGRWGLAAWGRGTEARATHRVGPWNNVPAVASASDPRPPVITSSYEAVVLASVRDADGLHHANLTWSPMAGAVGYRVYTCSESSFRAFHGEREPLPSETLTVRLARLRQLFAANSDRRPFTRLSTESITGTATPVALPRGTKDLHLFVVIGASAGEVESDWPSTSDPLCGKRFVAFAAPQLVAPGAPQLEVSRRTNTSTSPTSYSAALRVRRAGGAKVQRIDLYRVRVAAAAIDVDTMGPALASITGSAGGFTVVADPDCPIGVVTGDDTSPGSWKPVYYRAVAWGCDDPDRGQYGVRSEASVVRQVVVPPAGNPDLSAITWVLPTAGSANARLDFSTAAPIPDTVLGAHRIEVEVFTVDPAGGLTPVDVLGWDESTSAALPAHVASWTLAQLLASAPAPPDSGLWRDVTAAGTTPMHLLVRRPDASASLRVRVRLTDPLGRITEQVANVPPGAAGSLAPDIVSPVVSAAVGGWLMAFTTSVPNSNAEGDFVLDVRFAPTPIPPHKTSKSIRVSLAFPKLPYARRKGTILDDPKYVIPLSHSRRIGGISTITIGFRRPGSAQVTIIAPDGTHTSITRNIP
jgi:hypothetical protein